MLFITFYSSITVSKPSISAVVVCCAHGFALRQHQQPAWMSESIITWSVSKVVGDGHAAHPSVRTPITAGFYNIKLPVSHTCKGRWWCYWKNGMRKTLQRFNLSSPGCNPGLTFNYRQPQRGWINTLAIFNLIGLILICITMGFTYGYLKLRPLDFKHHNAKVINKIWILAGDLPAAADREPGRL